MLVDFELHDEEIAGMYFPFIFGVIQQKHFKLCYKHESG